MTRVKKAVHALKHRHTILRAAKGFRFARSKKERAATDALAHAGAYAFAHRRDKKGDFHFYKDAVVTIEKASFSVTPFPTSKKYTFQTNSESDANDWAIEIRKQVGFEVLTGLAAWFAVAWLACGWWPWCVVFVFSFLTVVSTQAETQEYHKPEKK